MSTQIMMWNKRCLKMRQESKSVIDDVVSRLWIAPISNTHIELAVKIAERCLGVYDPELKDMFFDPRKFSGGEYCPKFALNGKNLDGKSVYIIMVPSPYKTPEELVERACITARAAKENNAKKVVLLATDLPHARQDRGAGEDEKAKGEANTALLHAGMFRLSGIDQVITTHAHTPRLQAFFAKEYGILPTELSAIFNPSDERAQEIGKQVFKPISPHAILADYLLYHSWLAQTDEGKQYLANGGDRLALKAMDKGNRWFIDQLQSALFLENMKKMYCEKARKAKNDPKKVEVPIVWSSPNFRTLDGMVELNADDGMDTAGTMMRAVEWSEQGNICADTGRSYGTPDDRLVYFTHAWLGGEGHLGIQERICQGLPAMEFVTTNTHAYIENSQHYKFKGKSTVLRFAGLWADAILANEAGHDVTKRYTDFPDPESQHNFLSVLYRLKRHSRHFMVEEKELKERKINFYLRD
jgi:phosphoribosylpyrophosphate synthetase